MSKQIAKCFLFMEYVYGDDFLQPPKWRPALWKCKLDDEDDRIFVSEMDVEVDIPDDFDPTGQQIAALKRQEAEALRQYQQRVAEIRERISKLQAITYEASA